MVPSDPLGLCSATPHLAEARFGRARPALPGAEDAGPPSTNVFGPDARRVEVDLDGDGVMDGYVLLYATPWRTVVLSDPLDVLPHPVPPDQMEALVGRAFGDTDPFGL